MSKNEQKAQVGTTLKVEVKYYDTYEEAVKKAKEFNDSQKEKE